MTLPSACHLQRLAAPLSDDSNSPSQVAYLKLRSGNLSSNVKLLVVIMDETSQRLEFIGGKRIFF